MIEPSERLTTAFADRYRIERELGQGGMATVYLAEDVKLGREVALKVLRPELGAVLGTERFLAEVKITARLDHPHILTLIDSGRGCIAWCGVGSLESEISAQSRCFHSRALTPFPNPNGSSNEPTHDFPRYGRRGIARHSGTCAIAHVRR